MTNDSRIPAEDSDEARANIRAGLRTLEQNERQKTRIVADLATSLADLLTFTPDESRDYNGAKEGDPARHC